MKQLGLIVGASVLGIGLLATPGCEQVKEQCGFECAETGITEGNFAVSGNVAVDSFFKSVVNFGNVANTVAADIKAELDGIRLAFGVSDADLAASQGNIGAAINAKLQANFMASIVVDAQPAKCEVEASVAAEVTAECQVAAGCDVQPGMASVSCMGTCTAEVNATGGCEAEAKLHCEVSGPSVSCQGECSGSCTAQLEVAAACDGTCTGMCDAECVGDTDQGAGCNGQCMGMCQGSCELKGMAALNCQGSCNGSCNYEAPAAGCMGGAKVSCEYMANAMVDCNGSCEGEFVPPQVDCDASASCEASARAEAKFAAKCTPPSIDVKVEVAAGISAEAQAQLDYAVGELKVRLPRLLAAIEKSELVVQAGTQLTSDGQAAVAGVIDAIQEGEVDLAAAYKLGDCVPGELEASSGVITSSSANLQREVQAAASLTGTLGMGT